MNSDTSAGVQWRCAARASGLAAVLLFAWLAWGSGPANAAPRLFDPTISLTGGCGTTSLDSVKDPWCPGPPGPSAPFEEPSIAIDSFGDMYVSSHEEGPEGRIDVFGPTGHFITEIDAPGARSLAIDAKGNLYVHEFIAGSLNQVVLFKPGPYEPATETIDYGFPEVVVEEISSDLCGSGFLAPSAAVAVDPVSGTLFVSTARCVSEWSSADEGNEFKELIGNGLLTQNSVSLAVDSTRNRLYVTDTETQSSLPSVVKVFELAAPHDFIGSIDGSAIPGSGKFLSLIGTTTIDVDERNGDVFVSDLSGGEDVYEFTEGLDEEEEIVATYKREFKYVEPGEIAVDNSAVSPNRGTLYVPAGGDAVDHTYAFKEGAEESPEVEAVWVSGITEGEAVLHARVNSKGGETTYRFELATLNQFEEGGFGEAPIVGEGTLPPGIVGENVEMPVTGLQPGQAYRFRVTAVNGAGEDEGEGGFRAYGHSTLPPCPNEEVKTGYSAGLPDCRAYELVTPSDTNGRAAVGVGDTGVYFPTLEASSDGGKVSFRIEGGSLPGSDGSGAFNGENYLSTRTPTGWSSTIAAPSGTESISPSPGSVSPDQEFSFWEGDDNGVVTVHIRYPDGHSEFVGRGALATDPRVAAELITANGAHVIFATANFNGQEALKLEEAAPPDGTAAVYDRTADGVTHVVSLLPGNVTPAAPARYVGASLDGRGIAFEIGETLYLRHDDEETYKVGDGVTFAGIAEGGSRVFFVKEGNLFALDVGSGEEQTIPFSQSDNVTVANVSPDGSAAYILSPSVLTKEENPNEETAKKGQPNLYISREGDISFVATVQALDVAGKPGPSGEILGLGQWTKSLALGRPGIETSRVTPDGSALLFQSRAALTEYDPQGHVEIYRYDQHDQTLLCLSCNPTEVPASSDASLQSTSTVSAANSFLSTHARIPNLRPDGRRAFFQSSEALVSGDTDGVQDVYEWEADGVGSCQAPEGCVYLISSGQSGRDNHLFSASENGDDVFFLTTDILLSSDSEATTSIYDARVGGGFPESTSNPCSGEGCKPAITTPPSLVSPATSATAGKDNVVTTKCPKGKRKVKRRGRIRCVKKKKKPHHHRHVAAKKGGRAK